MKPIETKKINMTQIFDESGVVFPVTVLVSKDELGEGVLVEGDTVAVTGTSKGKGFQGVVKRHKFKGGRRSHGQKHSEREPGSIGGGARAGGRVAKGMRMAGRMGGDTVTVKNLKIIKLLPESKEIFVLGAVPGRRGSKVMIKTR
jgi:large subunit ribosomal protein L3